MICDLWLDMPDGGLLKKRKELPLVYPGMFVRIDGMGIVLSQEPLWCEINLDPNFDQSISECGVPCLQFDIHEWPDGLREDDLESHLRSTGWIAAS